MTGGSSRTHVACRTNGDASLGKLLKIKRDEGGDVFGSSGNSRHTRAKEWI